jgi:hypothetical protein
MAVDKTEQRYKNDNWLFFQNVIFPNATFPICHLQQRIEAKVSDFYEIEHSGK